MKTTHVLLFHNMAALKIRLDNVLKDLNVVISESGEEEIFLEMLRESGNGYSLVMMDMPINYDQNQFMELVSKARSYAADTPLIIFTDITREEFYLQAVLKGASDFIIKPFTDLTLIDKTRRYAGRDRAMMLEFVTMDVSRYIRGELKKAEKGNFPLSLMLLSFRDKEGNLGMDTELTDLFFKTLDNMLWDTDLFLKFTSYYHLGVFPFCDKDKTELVKQKIQNQFTMMKNVYRGMVGYDLITSFTTYPEDSDDRTAIFRILFDRID